MSGGCGCGARFDGMSDAYRRALGIVIVINAAMFCIEMTAGLLAGSQALKADALDFFADTLTYAMSLAVIGRPLRVRATAALLKGLSLAVVGLWVLGTTAYRVLVLGVPDAPVMGAVGLLALVANLTSVLVLLRYRDGDANVRSVWLCSRNDVIGNLAVILAAGAVAVTGAGWPDLLVAAFLAGLFSWSALHIIRHAVEERRAAALGAAAE